MNNLNYASREASQRLVDVGIVLEAENKRLMDEIRDLEWKIYRPLKEGGKIKR
jgi:hypothetical protein